MKYIITENQQHILWVKRRIPQYLDLMEDIVLEGFEYIDLCEYRRKDGYQDFSSDIIMSASITFANHLRGIEDLDPSDTDIVSEIVYEERRNQINETVGEFQRQIQLSYLKHKHLGEINTSEKIDLGNYLVLYGSALVVLTGWVVFQQLSSHKHQLRQIVTPLLCAKCRLHFPK